MKRPQGCGQRRKEFQQLTRVSNKSLLVVPSNVRRCDTVALVVDENLNLAALHDSDTRVSGAEIDTDDCACSVSSLLVICVTIEAYRVR